MKHLLWSLVFMVVFELRHSTNDGNSNKQHDGNTLTNKIDDNDVVQRPDFRLLKYQEVWDLVRKRLSDAEKLRELARILKKLDKTELEFKRAKERGDPTYSPEAEQTVLDMLPQLMKRYKLLDDIDNWKPKETHFDDARLQKWWTKGVAEGEFNGDELKQLHSEFHEMQKRLHNYVWLKLRIEEYEEYLNNETQNETDQVASNFVEDVATATDESEAGDAVKLSQMKEKLKDNFHGIDEDVMVLIEKIKTRIANVEKEDVYSDSRVAKLWEKAQELLIGNDLEIFKNDLNQFQTKISKLRHWEKIVGQLRPQLTETGFEKELREEYHDAKDRVKDLKRVVKKYHISLSNRVFNHIKTEL